LLGKKRSTFTALTESRNSAKILTAAGFEKMAGFRNPVPPELITKFDLGVRVAAIRNEVAYSSREDCVGAGFPSFQRLLDTSASVGTVVLGYRVVLEPLALVEPLQNQDRKRHEQRRQLHSAAEFFDAFLASRHDDLQRSNDYRITRPVAKQ